MSIGESLSRLLLKQLVDDVFTTGGAEALDAVIDFLLRCGEQEDPHLTTVLEQAMQRAWHVLEASLTGEPGWDHSQAGLAPRAAQQLRQCLGRLLAELAHGKSIGNKSTARMVANALRRQCLDDLCRARAGGALIGCLDREEWARSHDVFVRFATNQGRRDTRRRTEGQLLRDLEQQGCVGLMRLLTGSGGLPLLLMAARAFLCQELAQLLYFCLQEFPEQTPDDCTLVLETLQELSRPNFSLWRSPALAATQDKRETPVHWSRLKIDPAKKWRGGTSPRSAPKRSPRSRTASTPRASWALISVLTIAAALLVGVPIWLLVENAQRYANERQRVAAQHQRLRGEQRRIEEERQRLIEAQRRIDREERARQQALQRQREETERRLRMQAEAERLRAAERAEVEREEQQRRIANERRARLHELQQKRERARMALEDGLTHSALRQDREALTTLSEALRLDPDLPSAWSVRGAVRRRLGDRAGSLEDFQEAVRRNPRDASAWFQCGELHAEQGEYPQAIDAFTSVLRLEPNNLPAYRQRGLCYSRNDEVGKALADQTKAIELAPGDPWAYYDRANLHRLRNDLTLAWDDYTAAIDRGNTRGLAGAYRGRGMIALYRQNYNQAIKDLTRALDLDPLDSAAVRARSQAYLQNGEWTNALLDADGLIQHDAEDSAAYKVRGQAYMGLKDYQHAHDDFSRVLRMRRDAETFYLRARAKVYLGDIQEAIFDCNDATAINPRLACAFYLRGTLNMRGGYPISGLADCRTAHALDPQYPLP
ncbi:MAG TPA: tetratricopeptide repeat protein [Gemmataceae bacterium]|jgi:tetratricopeptide (TPR) repeat protein